MVCNNKLCLFTALLMLVLVFSCKQTGPDKENLSGVKTVSVIPDEDIIHLTWLAPWYGEGKKEDLMREIAREFAFHNQDIDLTLVFPHEVLGDEHWHNAVSANLIEMARNDEWPFDIMISDRSMIADVIADQNDPLWAVNNLVDFSNEDWFIEAHVDGTFSTGELAESYYGVVPGPVMEGNIYIMYISEVVEEMLGLDVKRHNMKISDFLSYAQAVYNYNLTADNKITFYSLQSVSAITMLFQQLSLSAHGGEVFSSDDESVSALNEVFQALEVLSEYNAFEQHGLIDPETGSLYAERELMHEQALFHQQPSWMYLLWEVSYPDRVNYMKPCEIPSMDNGSSPSYPGAFQTLFSVPSKGKNVEAARRLIRHMTTREVGEKWIAYTKNPTLLKTVISVTDFGQGDFDLFFRHIHDAYGINLQEVNLEQSFIGSDTADNFDIVSLAEEVARGNIPADDAVNIFLENFR